MRDPNISAARAAEYRQKLKRLALGARIAHSIYSLAMRELTNDFATARILL